ncbi:MAG: cation-transporting P-type ATPase, partial [Tepidisphaeraceae bacterium]
MGVGQATRVFRRAPPRPGPPATPRPQPPADHHALSIDDVVRRLQTDPQRGLSDAAIAARRRSHGRNELPQPPPVPWVLRLLKQFNSLMIWILIAAAGIALGTGEWADGGIILAIVVINGGLA